MSIADAIVEKLQQLPLEQQRQVLDFVESLVQKRHARTSHQTIWEKIDEIVQHVPEEVWDQVPTDGAEQHDHYLYGAPKK
jgi:hypothetical protein